MKLIFACVTGSHLYGTNRPDSDLDIRGICLNPTESLLGLTGFEQWLPNKDEALKWSQQYFQLDSEDVQVYGLNKFLQLALAANPNIIELLFADNLLDKWPKYQGTGVDWWTLWKGILAHRDDILSTKVVHTFSGYAYSQLQRIKGHKRWLDNPPEKPIPYEYGMVDTIKGGQAWTNSNLHNQYQNLLKDYQQYQTWLKERNPSRQKLEMKYGFDTKHAMHIIRLLLEAEELLTTGKIVFPFKGDRLTYLLDVLHGKYSYHGIVELGETSKDFLVALEEKSVLSKKPNIKVVEDLLIDINRSQLC